MVTVAPGANRALAEALSKVVTALKERPDEPALASFRAETRLVDNVLTQASIRRFAPLVIDEPPSLGGSDQGPNPVEIVLAALGTCQEIVYAAYAAVLGIPLQRLEITVSGDLDLRGLFAVAEVPAGFLGIRYDITIESPAPPEAIQQLRALVDAHCPVLDTLQRPVPITSSLTLNGASLD